MDFVKTMHGEKALEPHHVLHGLGYKMKTANSPEGGPTRVEYKHPKTKNTINLTHWHADKHSGILSKVLASSRDFPMSGHASDAHHPDFAKQARRVAGK
jgi:hypothetical protein